MENENPKYSVFYHTRRRKAAYPSKLNFFAENNFKNIDLLLKTAPVNKHKRPLLTAELRVAGVQRLEIDGVVCDKASLLFYRQLVPLDLDPSGLMDPY